MPPSHIPAQTSGFTDHMTFMERAANMALIIGYKMYFLNHLRLFDGFIQKHLPNSPGSSELIGNMSGCLINTNFIMDYPRLQPLSFFNIGGLSIQRQTNAIKDQVAHYMLCLLVYYFMCWCVTLPYTIISSIIRYLNTIKSFVFT
jgi:hypothetical protein